MKTIQELEKQLEENNKEITTTLTVNKKYSKEIPIYLIHILYLLMENNKIIRCIINSKRWCFI